MVTYDFDLCALRPDLPGRADAQAQHGEAVRGVEHRDHARAGRGHAAQRGLPAALPHLRKQRFERVSDQSTLKYAEMYLKHS